jgi:hypothetical protein
MTNLTRRAPEDLSYIALYQYDVTPHLFESTAAGFIGNTYFPVANTIFTSAVHLAGVTYF